jgi:hypothetical protein
MAAATGSRPAKATGRPRTRAAAPPSLAAGRLGGRRGAGTPGRQELDLIHLALAVVLVAGLEREQLSISRKLLQLDQELSYRHAFSVARPSHLKVRTALEVLNEAPSEFVSWLRGLRFETAVS